MTAFAQRSRKLTVPEFLAFYETRPDEERWQLVDGEALLMTPPFPAHQRIASNLERLLNDTFEARSLPYEAFQRIGTELDRFPHYRPDPDVTVVDRHIRRIGGISTGSTLSPKCSPTPMTSGST